MGLQGKLVISFVALLSISLGTSCWIFVTQSRVRLADTIGEQARQISYTLSLASKPAFETGATVELNQIGQDLLKSRNILFVGFLDAEGKPLVFASRDPDFDFDSFSQTPQEMQSLMQVRPMESPVFGEFLEVVAPVLSVSSPLLSELKSRNPNVAVGTRLMGYVAVGMSQTREQMQLQRVNYFVIGIGCIWVILAWPLAYVLVHRIFHPIRQLVTATNKIAAGELDTQVAIHRPDIIGTLARAFNEMVNTVKRQQDDLESANRDLEEKVRQRTGQLETANKRLSSEIAEKEDFLRAVSHDLNAPLRNISGMATMLLMKHRAKFDDDIIHRLERIQKNVEAETDLIAELLELSRIKTRRQKFEAIEIDAMVRELGDIFENDLKSGQINLVIDNPLPVLNCERARLRQVFQNLIDNAIKYMGEGSGVGNQRSAAPLKEIHVGCTMRVDEAEFYVRDTGMGIDPEDIDKVFFIFRRGRNGAMKNVAGKGVGLASVKSIIETYNGTIWVESKPGEGSTFRFTINGRHVPQSASTLNASGHRKELVSAN
jgi:signal transduction histidine kinase